MSQELLAPPTSGETGSWTEVGLAREEYDRIVTLLGREPNYLELGLFGVMWSEHCSYKNSRALLRRLPTTGPRVIQGPGENAGAIDVFGYTVVYKIESHNHPSAIEPYQGAATGVGGILRDVFTMGARPIAVLDSLRFGPLDEPRQRHLFAGVVSGVGGYGNSVGIPTVGGEVYFEDCYRGNCLVNAMCIGLLEGPMAKGAARGFGNPVLVVGARTGRDGIHGASLLASQTFAAGAEEKRPSVQVGDPFLEKLLLEACLELLRTDAVVGMQDMGAAGFISSSSEMASRAGTGIEIDVDRVPRREEGMTPYEIMLSESQERMLVVLQRGREAEAERIFHKYGLLAAVCGRVTDDGMIRVIEGGRAVAEVPARALAHEAPCYVRQGEEPAYLAEAQRFDPFSLPEPADYESALKRVLASPDVASKEWVYRQYDHMVRLNTVVYPGAADAAVLRLWRRHGDDPAVPQRGIAGCVDGNGRHVYLDPYNGGKAVVAEAARNVVCTGAEPAGVTNNLNFGNPERPDIYYQLERVIDGMAEACRALGTPVTGGNVSLYNETEGQAIYPTPTIGMIGVFADVDRRVTMGFKRPGDVICMLGESLPELGGSQYLKAVHGIVAGRPPQVDLAREKAVQQACLAAIRAGLVAAAHDCSDGGLAVTLSEMAFAAEPGARGCRAELPLRFRADAALFGESHSRIVLAVPRADLKRVREIAERHDVALQSLGQVTDGRVTIIGAAPQTDPVAAELLARGTLVDLPTDELERAWKEAIPCLMDAAPDRSES